MDNLQFIISQGSTPRLEMGLPFDLGTGDKAFVTFSQADRPVLEYSLNGTPTAGIAGTGTLSIEDGDSSMLVLSMSQADTMGLTPGDAEMQIRVKTNDGADAFFPLVGEIVRALKQGVIS